MQLYLVVVCSGKGYIVTLWAWMVPNGAAQAFVNKYRIPSILPKELVLALRRFHPPLVLRFPVCFCPFSVLSLLLLFFRQLRYGKCDPREAVLGRTVNVKKGWETWGLVNGDWASWVVKRKNEYMEIEVCDRCCCRQPHFLDVCHRGYEIDKVDVFQMQVGLRVETPLDGVIDQRRHDTTQRDAT